MEKLWEAIDPDLAQTAKIKFFFQSILKQKKLTNNYIKHLPVQSQR